MTRMARVRRRALVLLGTLALPPAVPSPPLEVCAGGSDDPVAGLPLVASGQMVGEGPVTRPGEHIEWGLWAEPALIKEGPLYVMYATSSLRESFRPPIVPFQFVLANDQGAREP